MLASATFDKNTPPNYEQTMRASGKEPLVPGCGKMPESYDKRIESAVRAALQKRDKEKTSIKCSALISNSLFTGGAIVIGWQVGAIIQANPGYAMLVTIGSLGTLFLFRFWEPYCQK